MVKVLAHRHTLGDHIQQKLHDQGDNDAVKQIVVKEDGTAHQRRQRDDGVPCGGHIALVHIGDVHQLLGGGVLLEGCAAGLYPLIGLLQAAHLGEYAQRQQQAQQHHSQRIEHKGDGLQIVVEAQVKIGDQSHTEGRPAGEGDGDAQTAGHNVGLHRQMLTGDAVFVADAPHGDGDRQGVEIFVHEHDHRQKPGQQQRPLRRGGHPCQQVTEPHQRAGGLQQRDHSAEADDDAQGELVGGVGQRGIHGVDGAGEEMLPVQQHHGQQRGQDHGLGHPPGLEGIDDQKHKWHKGHNHFRHSSFSLPGQLSVV